MFPYLFTTTILLLPSWQIKSICRVPSSLSPQRAFFSCFFLWWNKLSKNATCFFLYIKQLKCNPRLFFASLIIIVFFAALLSPSPKKGVSACSVATWQAHLAYCLVASCEHGFVSFIEQLFQTLLLSIGHEKGRGHFRGSLSKLHSAIYFDLGVVYVFSELGYNIRGGDWNCTFTFPWIAST